MNKYSIKKCVGAKQRVRAQSAVPKDALFVCVLLPVLCYLTVSHVSARSQGEIYSATPEAVCISCAGLDLVLGRMQQLGIQHPSLPPSQITPLSYSVLLSVLFYPF